MKTSEAPTNPDPGLSTPKFNHELSNPILFKLVEIMDYNNYDVSAIGCVASQHCGDPSAGKIPLNTPVDGVTTFT